MNAEPPNRDENVCSLAADVEQCANVHDYIVTHVVWPLHEIETCFRNWTTNIDNTVVVIVANG